MNKLRIASRISKLALVQTHMIIDAIKRHHPEIECEIVEVVTTGDRIQERALAEIGGKGLFIKGLEERLLAKEADLAMHSLKDVPPSLEASFSLSAVLPRQSPHDAFISTRFASLEDLPEGAIVGTSSIRRQAALLHKRPDLQIKMLRGNVDTRLKKLEAGEFDAIILAEAGLQRLQLDRHIRQVLPLSDFVPSVGQGVVAIETLSEREDLKALLAPINHTKTYARIIAERALTHALQASCTSPIGSFAQIEENTLSLVGVVWSPDGKVRIESNASSSIAEAEQLGKRVASLLIEQGAHQLLDTSCGQTVDIIGTGIH